MNKYTIILIFLFANVLAYGQDFDFFSHGEYSNDPVVDSGLIIRFNDLNEPLINELEICDDCEIYRFTWLRTFDNPVIVRLERKADIYKFVYKIGKGAAGYEPEGLKKSKSIKITNTEWDYFVNLLNNSGFDTIPNRFYFPMCDGTTWILEHRSAFDYKAHETNEPDSLFMICGLYLLELTGREYHKTDVPCDYSNNRIFLNNEFEIIHKNEVIDSLIAHLNREFSKKPPKSDWCNYPDNIITINSRGKVTKVKTLTGEGFFLDIAYYFEDWTCRNIYRKAFRNIDLSSFDLKRKIKVYLSCNYDKEKKIIYYDE